METKLDASANQLILNCRINEHSENNNNNNKSTYGVDNKTMHRFCLEVFVVSVLVILFLASFGCANIKSFINAPPSPKLTTPGGDTWVTTTIAATTVAAAAAAAALKQWSNRRNLTGDLDTAVDPWRWQKKSLQNQGKTKTISLRSVVEN